MQKRDHLRVAWLALGLLLIAAGVFVAVRSKHNRANDYSYLTATLVEPPEGPGIAHFWSSVPEIINVTAPKKLRLGESASVSVSASLADFLTRLKAPQASPLGIYLAGAGLEIEPKERLHLHLSDDREHWTAAWTVRASSAGTYRLVLDPEIELPVAETKGQGRAQRTPDMAIKFQPQAELTIEVVRGWSEWLAAAAGAFTAFMGSLLTLPGILAWHRRRKRAREEKEKHTPVFE